MNDLGRVHYKYLKHISNGSSFFVLVKNQKNLASLNLSQGMKLQDVDRLLNKMTNSKNSLNSLSKESSADELNFLIRNIKVCLFM